MSASLTDDLLAGHDRLAPALVKGGRVWSYEDLRMRVDELAAWLDRAGVRAGDTIAVVLPNGVEQVSWLLAAWKVGAADVALPTSETSARLLHTLRGVLPTVVVARDRDAWLNELGGESVTVSGAEPGSRTRLFPFGRAPSPWADDLARRGVCSIQFTSGSTGEPKGVMHTHAGLRATVLAAAHLAELPGNRLLLTLPISNSYGRTHLMEFLFAGASVALEAAALPGDLLAAMRTSQATAFESPPAVYEALVRSERFSGKELPRLKRIGTAGGKLSPQLVATLLERFPGAQVVNRYGVTEISGPLCRGQLRIGEPIHCGPPVPSADLRLDPIPEAPEGTGRIYARGPGMMAGYFPVFDAPIWYDTGDVGRFDQRGRMQLVDRASDMIKRLGIRVFPAEVEREIACWPGVGTCTVLGVEVEGSTIEHLAAFVVTGDNGPTEAELVRIARGTLPPAHVPDLIMTLDALPVAFTGKVDRKALRDLARGRLENPRRRTTGPGGCAG